jgi:hypothetical protein
MTRHLKRSFKTKKESPRREVLPTEAPVSAEQLRNSSGLAPIKSAIPGLRMGHFGPQGGAETTFY